MTTKYQYRDPHAAIVRDVVLYPASGDDLKPRICKMTFNEAGANHPRGLYTTAIDLRSTYENQMRLTRFQVLDVENQLDKHTEGEYMFYYNLSPSLPVNAAMALIVGVNPKRPGWRPIWRGDVVVVKTQEWPVPIKMGEGAHMDYVDVPLSVLGSFDRFIRKWYLSEQWGNTLKTEQEWRKYFNPTSKICF